MREEIREYLDRSQRYWKQGLEHLSRKDRGKGTELLWGSIVEMVKTLALTKGKLLRRHREVKNYMRDLAVSLPDPELYELYKRAESWHSNFYEEFMDEGDVKEAIINAEHLLKKLHKLLDRKEE